MVDDAHEVTFDDVASDRRCWGSGTTRHGCGREATSALGLCDTCHAEIAGRGEESRAQPSPAAGRVVEMNVELDCRGRVVSRTCLPRDPLC